MGLHFKQREVALAIAAVIGSMSMVVATDSAMAQTKTPGKYVAGDFHNHTTCSDGSLSMQKLVKKATATWGLDWFVQAGHGGNGNRNCTLTEDSTLGTPNFPHTNQGPTTTWANSIGNAALKGDTASTTGLMWRWQSLQSFQYQVLEDQSVRNSVPLFLGMESVVAGHEHTSMSVITGQMPTSIDTLSNGPAINPLKGNADALAQWSYCFDRGDTDLSRGTTNQWACSYTGSLLSGDTGSAATATNPWWSAAGQKLSPVAGVGAGNGVGDRGHAKTVEAIKWMAANHPTGSYYVPAHLERAGPFNPTGNNGFNVENLRNFNNAGPDIAFGMETQPGHGASQYRGEYQPNRQTINGVPTDSVGTSTFGGTGIYGAQIGGVWDALLGEGRNFWFFASSDWHNRGIFNADDRRSTQDFQPGEYQRNYTLVRNGTDKLRPQTIVDGLRSGNNFAASGQLIDRLSFIVCQGLTPAAVQGLAVTAASTNTAVDNAACANMGERLTVTPGTDLVVGIVVRDPAGTSNSPYSFPNPSLAQVSINQPMNAPVLDHIDLIGGLVTGLVAPGTAAYSGAWPDKWVSTTTGAVQPVSAAPVAARNTSTVVTRTFSAASGLGQWSTVSASGADYLAMTYTITGATASQYVRLRGTNLPAAVPFETDSAGNPLPDVFTNAGTSALLRIPCKTVGTNVPALGSRLPYTGNTIDGCPSHLPTATIAAVLDGNGNVITPAYTGKVVAYDVAAWADLWFYSNPIYVQVQ